MFSSTGAVEGDPFWDAVRDQLLGVPSNETKDCHKPKPILFNTGEVGCINIALLQLYSGLF